MATLEDLEARVTALEATQADYPAVLAAVNALGANQSELSLRLAAVENKVDSLGGQMADMGGQMADTNARVRSLEEGQSEIKELLIRALDR